jgi:hypothetical protein
MAAVVALADGDPARVEQDKGRVQRGEPAGVAYGVAVEKRRGDGFEAGCIRREFARVDVVLSVEFFLRIC